MEPDSGISILTANASYSTLVRPVVEKIDTSVDSWSSGNHALVLLDFPLTWALRRLMLMNSMERSRTVVATQAVHPAYHDVLASYHVSSVVNTHDTNGLITGIYAAASAMKVYKWKSGLTYMELRVTRLLLLGYDTAATAESLRISQKTVNAHVSNILVKLKLQTRAQFIATLVSHPTDRPPQEGAAEISA